jgi:hypothetical protein
MVRFGSKVIHRETGREKERESEKKKERDEVWKGSRKQPSSLKQEAQAKTNNNQTRNGETQRSRTLCGKKKK